MESAPPAGYNARPMPEPAEEFAVIPDLHGRRDALEALLRAVGFVDAEGRPREGGPRLVQLGDLVDRGPDSRGCVERLMELQVACPGRVTVLLGNHESMLLGAENDPMLRRMWLLNGGGRTLASYEGFEGLIRPGGAHYDWLRGLPRTFESGGVLFCHAGLSKARKGSVDPEGVLWDRPPLVKGSYRAVVCGHTPTESGAVEEAKGVWRCDLGLGHGTEKVLEALVLRISDSAVEARRARGA